jgi:hypothetical protein
MVLTCNNDTTLAALLKESCRPSQMKAKAPSLGFKSTSIKLHQVGSRHCKLVGKVTTSLQEEFYRVLDSVFHFNPIREQVRVIQPISWLYKLVVFSLSSHASTISVAIEHQESKDTCSYLVTRASLHLVLFGAIIFKRMFVHPQQCGPLKSINRQKMAEPAAFFSVSRRVASKLVRYIQ